MAIQNLPSILPNPSTKTLKIASLASLLIFFSYLLALHHPFFSSHSLTLKCSFSSSLNLSFLPLHSAESLISLPHSNLTLIPLCSLNFTHYCPCQDPNFSHQFSTRHFAHRARHCPSRAERPSPCRIPRPRGYRVPVPWPESRRSVWFKNVPFKKLSEFKADQNWVRIEGDRFVFPGGGTSFPHGVEWYVGQISKVVPLKTGEIRTVMDIGCGVASFGNHLLDYNVLTMSVAPRDVHEAQVQFVLERGLPAILGVLSIYRLPYPSRSFDMVHCSRCLIKWASRGNSIFFFFGKASLIRGDLFYVRN